MFYKCFRFNLIILLLGCVCISKAKECYTCEGINCLMSSKLTNKAACADKVDSCVTVFEGSTALARGCYTTLPELYRNKCNNAFGAECHQCSESLCNDRASISCLQCNSENSADCQSAASNIKLTRCPISATPNSYCYTRKLSNKTESGCLVDTDEQLKCLADSSCEMCVPDGEDACNQVSEAEIESGGKRLTAICVLTSTFVIISLAL